MPLHIDPLTDGSPAFASGNDAPRKVRRSLPMALLRAREAVMARFRPMLIKHDISEQQWRVIRVLDEYGELDASDLARRSIVLGPSLTRMIRSLEQRKLLVRRKDKNDGRRILLAITPKAKAFIKEIMPESTAIYREIEERFGVEKIDDILALLDSLSEQLEG